MTCVRLVTELNIMEAQAERDFYHLFRCEPAFICDLRPQGLTSWPEFHPFD